MGEDLIDGLRQRYPASACRIYAPVGAHENLLAYLVRRLLENGANSSFVSRLGDRAVAGLRPADAAAGDHRRRANARARRAAFAAGHSIAFAQSSRTASSSATPRRSTRSSRALAETPEARRAARSSRARRDARRSQARRAQNHLADRRIDGARRRQRCGDRPSSAQGDGAAQAGFRSWSRAPVERRASLPRRRRAAARSRGAALAAPAPDRGGQDAPDAVSEWREAIDFCAITPPGRANAGARRGRCRDRPARTTGCYCRGARRFRLHQPVEFSARHFPRPGRRGACRRQ